MSVLRAAMLVASGAMLTLSFQQLRPPPPAFQQTECAQHTARIAVLEASLTRLLKQQRERPQCPPAEKCAHAVVAAAAGPHPGGGVGVAAVAAPPPPPTQRWSWTGLALNAMRPFEKLNGGITLRGLRLAEQKCKISTWCHRAQVIGGRLYITDIRSIFFDRHYAMARVMPLLLTMKRHAVPDLDAVFSGTDYPIMEIPRDAAHMGRMYGQGQPIPPVFAPTANSVSHDIPWPDFSFFPPIGSCGARCSHPLKTPRWQIAHPQLLEIGRRLPFREKIDRAVFTGNMKTSPNRRQIFSQAERFPELLFVNEVLLRNLKS